MSNNAQRRHDEHLDITSEVSIKRKPENAQFTNLYLST